MVPDDSEQFRTQFQMILTVPTDTTVPMIFNTVVVHSGFSGAIVWLLPSGSEF